MYTTHSLIKNAFCKIDLKFCNTTSLIPQSKFEIKICFLEFNSLQNNAFLSLKFFFMFSYIQKERVGQLAV